MFQLGQKVCLKTDPKIMPDIFTVQSVSEFVEMVKLAEIDIWIWTDNLVAIN